MSDVTRRFQPRKLEPIAPKLVKAELTFHYDGPAGRLDFGYRIRAVLEDELLAMGAVPLEGPELQTRSVTDTAAWVDSLARSYLSPF